MSHREYKWMETSKFKFEICGHRGFWYVAARLPNDRPGYPHYLQRLQYSGPVYLTDLRLGQDTGPRRSRNLLTWPGYYRTRAQARETMKLAKCFFSLRCEV